MELELDEWEFLPDKKSLVYSNHDSAKDQALPKDLSMFGELILMDYFICPSLQFKDSTETGKELVTSAQVSSQILDENTEDVCISSPVMLAMHDHVQFQKIKEDGFVDMKAKLSRPPSTRELFIINDHNHDGYDNDYDDDSESRVKELDHKLIESLEDKKKRKSEGLSIWIWGLRGIGGILSFGIAAAVCVFISTKDQKHHQIKIYTDDESVKQMVRVNKAFSVGKGASVTRAHISFGGYYEWL